MDGIPWSEIVAMLVALVPMVIAIIKTTAWGKANSEALDVLIDAIEVIDHEAGSAKEVKKQVAGSRFVKGETLGLIQKRVAQRHPK